MDAFAVLMSIGSINGIMTLTIFISDSAANFAFILVSRLLTIKLEN
jgi:hypothetical protein